MKNILIIGATSKIAESFTKLIAENGYFPILAGRNISNLKYIARDIEITNNLKNIPVYEFDVLQTRKHVDFFNEILKEHSKIYGCLIACGAMYEQAQCESNFNNTEETIFTNLTGIISITTILANYFEKEKTGFISCISSVAGDRGRYGNFIYGASKSGLSTYLEGLRCKLYKSNVLVQTVKPGPVDTPMTKGLTKLPLLASPEKVALCIYKGIINGKTTVYAPCIWKIIMTIIKLIPEKIYIRLKL